MITTLDLNASETKERIIDSRHCNTEYKASAIHDWDIQKVQSCNYLGTVFEHQLKFDVNNESIVKQSQQRIFLLRIPLLFIYWKSFNIFFYLLV